MILAAGLTVGDLRVRELGERSRIEVDTTLVAELQARPRCSTLPWASCARAGGPKSSSTRAAFAAARCTSCRCWCCVERCRCPAHQRRRERGFGVGRLSVKTAWLDATQGLAGDMLLGACVDAGVPLAALQQAVDGLRLPERVELSAEQVLRAGLAATQVHVRVERGHRQRPLAEVLRLLAAGELPPLTAQRAARVFTLLGEAEARVHGVGLEHVHFHEVGALDALADVVGAVTGLIHLGVERLVVSRLTLGSGRTRSAHGELPVPVPAVLALVSAAGAPVTGGPVELELATPTGVALAVGLADG